MKKSASYILSAYSFISTETLENLISVGCKIENGDPIPSFDEKLLVDLCSEAQQIFAKEKNIIMLEGDFVIVGDIHGSFHDLLRILHFIKSNNSKALFLGDYVDRGQFSLECITILFALKVVHPDIFYLIRGNHEFDSLCSKYGFKNEIISMKKSQSLPIQSDSNDEYRNAMFCYRYSEKLYKAFMKAFSYLPIAALVNKTTFCIHGGLSPKLDHVDQIENLILRPLDDFESNDLLTDVIWSDPSYGSNVLFDENPRGRGYFFNDESVIKFLRKNSLIRMIRAHQCVLNGYLLSAGEKCITIFSASSYDTVMNNQSSVLQLFENNDRFNITTFPPLKRLLKCEAFYYKVQSLDMHEADIHSCFSLLHPTIRASRSVRIITSITSNQSSESLAPTRRIHGRQSTLAKSRFITNRRRSQNISLAPIILPDEDKETGDDPPPTT
ncbi:hypothetical protein M9Y10_000266 [Tritrichomonas musculus]|uniref:Serine/threonine-protein phosphatase n=1 Tax=Tritrichomonas musculus TaxID=1915356 RepID=A0ABR2L3V3_9EUKA